MTDPVVYHPNRRLVSLMRKPGGVTIEDGVANAKARLEDVRTECVGGMDVLIDSLVVESPTPEEFRRVYLQCSEILGLAGAFGFEEENVAAKALCSLLEGFGSTAEPPCKTDESLASLKEAVEVIANGLKALRRTETTASPATRQEVVRGLQQVAEKRLRSAGADR